MSLNLLLNYFLFSDSRIVNPAVTGSVLRPASCMAQNFRGSLILPEISTVCENIYRKFLTQHTQFSRSDCRSVDGQHPGVKLPNPQDTLSKVAIALLIAATSSRQ